MCIPDILFLIAMAIIFELVVFYEKIIGKAQAFSILVLYGGCKFWITLYQVLTSKLVFK